jgi:ATP-dependent metalloprotease FtsH
MLVEMDGFGSGTGVVVLAGTNRKDILDPALTRPGRFDRTISIDKPDLCDREEIFHVHLKPLKLGESLTYESVAKRMAALTPGFAGADIANICNEAAIFAARRTSEAVEMIDFEQATERVIGGLAKNNNLMGAEQKRCVALHESGHALAGWFLENADPLLKVSIVPRSNGALGFAQYLPAELALHSREAILDKMAVALGGRAAEELFVGQISTGASDDLDKVTKMAYAMVTVYGMNPEIGLVSYGQGNPQEQFYKPYSEETGQIIDTEARALIDQQYTRVKDLLLKEEAKLKALSDKLFEKETLVYNDIKGCLGDRPFPIPEAYAKFVTSDGSMFDIPKEEKAEAEKTSEGPESGGMPDEKTAAPAAAMACRNASKTTSS